MAMAETSKEGMPLPADHFSPAPTIRSLRSRHVETFTNFWV